MKGCCAWNIVKILRSSKSPPLLLFQFIFLWEVHYAIFWKNSFPNRQCFGTCICCHCIGLCLLGVGVNSGQRTQVVAEVNGESIYYTDVQKSCEECSAMKICWMKFFNSGDAIEELIKQTALQTYTGHRHWSLWYRNLPTTFRDRCVQRARWAVRNYTIKSSLEKHILRGTKSSNESWI